MVTLPQGVRVVEVGPRDGLQNEPQDVPTADKIAFVDRLTRSGLTHIEVTSFVKPSWIPQLADAQAVVEGIQRRAGVLYSALVPNRHGLDRALQAGVNHVAVLVSASETHNRRNLNRSIAESLRDVREVLAGVRGAGLPNRCYVSMVFGCPFEGDVPVERIRSIVAELAEAGVDEVSLGDTVGYATPLQVWQRIPEIARAVPADHLALHFHDTRGTGLANVLAGIEVGVRTFDGSVGGLGGCPYAPGASGNLATEDLVQMLHGMGIQTGIDLPALVDASAWIETRLGKRLPGRYLRAATGPCTMESSPPGPSTTAAIA